MKNIIFVIILFTLFFTSHIAFARGLSTGLFTSYSIDNGAIDDAISRSKSKLDGGSIYSFNLKKDEPIEIAGIALFLRYDFQKNFFVRSGFEANFTTNSAQLRYYDGAAINEYIFEYTAYTVPLYIGATISPDRGKTSAYGGAGIFYSMVEIERKIYQESVANLNITTKSSADIFGIGGIIGLERVIIYNISLMFEYVFYSGTYIKSQSEYDQTFGNTYYYKERYSLPAQQMRAGLKYNF